MPILRFLVDGTVFFFILFQCRLDISDSNSSCHVLISIYLSVIHILILPRVCCLLYMPHFSSSFPRYCIYTYELACDLYCQHLPSRTLHIVLCITSASPVPSRFYNLTLVKVCHPLFPVPVETCHMSNTYQGCA